MAQTAREYHENSSNHGGYQYVTLKEIIDELLFETTDPDGYLSNVPRSRLFVKAKKGIHSLSKEVKDNVLAAEITVGPKLFLVLPQDFVDWVRVSVVGKDRRLYPMRENRNIQTAVGYLQDHDYNILFDDQGRILEADASNVYNKGFRKYVFCPDAGQNSPGEFVIDKKRGRIGFSSDLEGKEMVIEYISDGLEALNLNDEEITIHKNLKDVLLSYVYMKCIQYRIHVPQSEKLRAKNDYKALLHKAKIDHLDFNITDLTSKISVNEGVQQPNPNVTIVQSDDSGSSWGSFNI